MENLVERFDKAGLTLVRSSKPLVAGRGMDDIVQIDIKRKIKGNARTEHFEIYPGRGEVLIQVRDVDKEKRQLVLMVKEGKRVFEETLSLPRATPEQFEKAATERARAAGATIVKMDSKNRKAVVQRTTPPEIRHYLMGVDERQLFIARLAEPCETVDKARKNLGKSVQFAEGKKNITVDRQGEWFFIETTDAQRYNIDDQIKNGNASVFRKVAIGDHHVSRRAGGNPHTADELVVLDPKSIAAEDVLPNGFSVQASQTFIRGAVRHADHKTVVFKHWRLVVANNEGRETASANRSLSGVLWID